MRAVSGFLMVAVLTFSLRSAHGQDAKALPRATPESQGISSQAIGAFIAALDQKVTTMHPGRPRTDDRERCSALGRRLRDEMEGTSGEAWSESRHTEE